jgi:hypothetical protein
MIKSVGWSPSSSPPISRVSYQKVLWLCTDCRELMMSVGKL